MRNPGDLCASVVRVGAGQKLAGSIETLLCAGATVSPDARKRASPGAGHAGRNDANTGVGGRKSSRTLASFRIAADQAGRKVHGESAAYAEICLAGTKPSELRRTDGNGRSFRQPLAKKHNHAVPYDSADLVIHASCGGSVLVGFWLLMPRSMARFASQSASRFCSRRTWLISNASRSSMNLQARA